MGKTDLRGEGRRVLAGVLIGAAVAVILSILLVLIMAPLISSGAMGRENEKPLVLAAAFLSAAVGGIVARVKNAGAALISAVASAGLAALVRMLVMLVSDQSTAFDSTDLAVLVSMLCGGLVIGTISFKRRKKRR